MESHEVALERAKLSLDGLSVGDALGESFLLSSQGVVERIAKRELPAAPWHWTDDTEMALSIFEQLEMFRQIAPDSLALAFARRFDGRRGYGSGAARLLQELRSGASWMSASRALFGGQGSYGNGAAMRVAPIGAYFANDLQKVVSQATDSARVTHAHPEGIAGAVAVALAAAVAWQQGERARFDPAALLRTVLERMPGSETRRRIDYVSRLSFAYEPIQVARQVGSGAQLSAQDTVPFCLWCAARHLNDYQSAVLASASGLGDMDTTCAIVGGIVGPSSRNIPLSWLDSREPLIFF